MDELQKEEESIGKFIDGARKIEEANRPEYFVFFTFINEDDEEKEEYKLSIKVWREFGGIKEEVTDPTFFFTFSDKEEREASRKRIIENYINK